MTFVDVTFHENSPFFSPPSHSPTHAAASPTPSFPPLVVIADPLPSVPLLHSFSPLLLLLFLRFSPSHLLQIPIPYPPTPLPPRHPRSSFPKPLQMIFTFPSPFARVHALILTIPFLTFFPMIVFLHSCLCPFGSLRVGSTITC